jgi:hypothetical protein
MRKIVLTFGLIAGVIVGCLELIVMSLSHSGAISFDKGEIFGYGSMVIALSMIFFGTKSYRDNHQSGAIKFSKGLQVGILITLIASLMYAASWEVYLLTTSGGQDAFMKMYTEHYIEKMKNEGATEAEIEQKTKQLTDMAEMYRNPVIRFGMTLMEILPVGVIITLISAAILRRKEVLPA